MKTHNKYQKVVCFSFEIWADQRDLQLVIQPVCSAPLIYRSHLQLIYSWLGSMRQIWHHRDWVGATDWSGEGCIPVLSPRACPLPGGRSDRRSLLGEWAEPPMLLVDQRPLSAQESGRRWWEGKWVWECDGRGREWWNSCVRKDGYLGVRSQVPCKAAWEMEKKKVTK